MERVEVVEVVVLDVFAEDLVIRVFLVSEVIVDALELVVEVVLLVDFLIEVLVLLLLLDLVLDGGVVEVRVGDLLPLIDLVLVLLEQPSGLLVLLFDLLFVLPQTLFFLYYQLLWLYGSGL